jgi:hypothetical protein
LNGSLSEQLIISLFRSDSYRKGDSTALLTYTCFSFCLSLSSYVYSVPYTKKICTRYQTKYFFACAYIFILLLVHVCDVDMIYIEWKQFDTYNDKNYDTASVKSNQMTSVFQRWSFPSDKHNKSEVFRKYIFYITIDGRDRNDTNMEENFILCHIFVWLVRRKR